MTVFEGEEGGMLCQLGGLGKGNDLSAWGLGKGNDLSAWITGKVDFDAGVFLMILRMDGGSWCLLRLAC